MGTVRRQEPAQPEDVDGEPDCEDGDETEDDDDHDDGSDEGDGGEPRHEFHHAPGETIEGLCQLGGPPIRAEQTGPCVSKPVEGVRVPRPIAACRALPSLPHGVLAAVYRFET